MSKDTSGPISPVLHNGSTLPGMKGTTLRQWYAGLAMQGMIASGALTRKRVKPRPSGRGRKARSPSGLLRAPPINQQP